MRASVQLAPGPFSLRLPLFALQARKCDDRVLLGVWMPQLYNSNSDVSATLSTRAYCSSSYEVVCRNRYALDILSTGWRPQTTHQKAPPAHAP
jgi:hypothetical protein